MNITNFQILQNNFQQFTLHLKIVIILEWDVFED